MDIKKTGQAQKVNVKNLKLLYERLHKKAQNGQGKENSTQTNNSSPSNLISRLSAIIENFDIPLQKTLLKTWLEMNLPLKEENINQLIKLLNNNTIINNPENSQTESGQPGVNQSTVSSESIIKSFAFLTRHKLPLLPQLIEGLARNLDPENSITKSLNSGTENPDSSLQNVIKNRLSFDLNSSVTEIAENLKNYPEELKQIISQLNNSRNSSTEKILDHLLGQQIVNSRESNQDSGPLLFLEIPVLFSEKDNPLPLYLKIWRQNDKDKEEVKNQKGLKVSFIIELKKRGPIRADINIYSNHIQSKFLTTSEETAALIKENFHYLQERLENLGFTMEKPLINRLDGQEQFKENKKLYVDSLLAPLPGDKNQIKKTPDKYIHVDFKI